MQNVILSAFRSLPACLCALSLRQGPGQISSPDSRASSRRPYQDKVQGKLVAPRHSSHTQWHLSATVIVSQIPTPHPLPPSGRYSSGLQAKPVYFKIDGLWTELATRAVIRPIPRRPGLKISELNRRRSVIFIFIGVPETSGTVV